MQRRDLFPMLGAAAAAGPLTAAPHVFTEAEYALLEHLCDLLIPTDESGPGARQAGVAHYIDLTLHHAPEQQRTLWRSGLLAVNNLAQQEAGNAFLKCTPAQQARILDRMAAGEQQPQSAAERFFVLWKAAAIQGFAWSVEGRKALGYRGDQMTGTFTGCTHAGHHQS